MKQIHLIMPMAGKGQRFQDFSVPKPLIKINDKPFFYWATKSVSDYVDLKDITFVILKEHVLNFEIDKVIKKYFPDAKIKVLDAVLNGAVLTCEKGVEDINDDLPIIFNDCDHMFISNAFYDFVKKGDFSKLDGALLTFKANDPKYSYIKKDLNGNVILTKEKEVISDEAICGAYYFRNKKVFTDSCKVYLDNCDYNEYYVSGIYNVMASNNMPIKTFVCEKHISFGTPKEYEEAKMILKRIYK